MKPVRFSFVLHMHQPVGNFDSVFREHATEVYLPLLERLVSGRMLPIGLHLSGPLLNWLSRAEPGFLDRVRGHVEAGTIEILTSGRYEPILAVLSPEDRRDQLDQMAALLRTHFGVDATTLWLTERVWEGAIVPELVESGIQTVLVDDWHFRVSGMKPNRLVRPFRTEEGGLGLNVLPISERLRYLIPFSEVDSITDHLRGLSEHEVPFALFGDDGEKFGGWPRTREWVWEAGWIHAFVEGITAAAERGWVELVTPSQAVAKVPSGGLVYLGSASYSEMEEWTLPPELSGSYGKLRDHVQSGRDDLGGDPEADLLARVRGSHWRNFLVRYAEANRLHKKALMLSRLARERVAPRNVLDAIGRAQSNDPLWHGVFGGLYMRHLRDAAWRSLAEAEMTLREGEPLSFDVLDFDYDGHDELWVHSDQFSALVSPARGGAIEEFTLFNAGLNEADVLTRYREAYHVPAVERWREWRETHGDPEEPRPDTEGASSIHDLETAYMLEVLPYADVHARSLVVERVLVAGDGAAELESGSVTPVWSSISTLGRRKTTYRARPLGSGPSATVEVVVAIPFEVEGLRPGLICTKTMTFDRSGLREISYRWPAEHCPEGAHWTVEVSQQSATCPHPSPDATVESYTVVTVPRSERGFERIEQGHAHVIQWPVSAGECRLVWPSRSS